MSSGTVPSAVEEDLPSPFGELGFTLSDAELRETAYEILVGTCRSSGGKPLTYVPRPDRTARTVASRVKMVLGSTGEEDAVNSVGRTEPMRPVVTVSDVMRVQMRVSEQTDARIRKALLRISAGKVSRRIESMVLPLELLQQVKPSDYPSQQQYEVWQNKIMKVLEAGLLLHPRFPLEKTDSSSQKLQQIIHAALEKPIKIGNTREPMQSIRTAAMSLACRSLDGPGSEICHWADGFPLNLRLYQMLLEACFDADDPASIIEEVDDALELIKNTWIVLGMNEVLHNLCYAWVLFHHYALTGQVNKDLLSAADYLMVHVGKNAKELKDPFGSKALISVLRSVLGWVEKRLIAYHNAFYTDRVDSLESILSLAALADKILEDDTSHECHRKKKVVFQDRIDTYIRSSMRVAFNQQLEKTSLRRNLSKEGPSFLPMLTCLAQDISELASNEKEIFSPILQRWHPLAVGVAMATLHACYGNELKKYVLGINELSPDAVHVLLAAGKLEKSLADTVVEDSVESEDGGKGIIQEMTPYEAQAIMASLVKSWICTRVDRTKELVVKKLQEEAWDPKGTKGHFAPSIVEVLRTINESLEAFFLLPIPMHPLLLPDLVNGLDKCLQHYILKAKSGCGNRSTYVPTLPTLTRCSTGSKYQGVFKKKDKPQITQMIFQVGTTDVYKSGTLRLCVRINTLQHIWNEVEILERRTMSHLQNSGYPTNDIVKFDLSAAACEEGTQRLCEATAYKVIFHDLNHVLFDGLYIGEVSYSRIEPFLEELKPHLEIMSKILHDRARELVISDIMKASFDGFLFVLFAGGPSRSFTQQDSAAIEEDLKFLKDLFWSNGDGLPKDLIHKISATIRGVLPLLRADTENLIEQLRYATLKTYGSSAKSKLPLPPTSDQWDPFEPNTLLRVLCYRNDEKASKFLKKTYNLPKNNLGS